MGLYVEPGYDKSKFVNELIVTRRAQEFSPVISTDVLPSTIPNDQVIICLVNNGMFHALAVAFNDAEFKVFADPSDTRYKIFCVADKDVIKQNTPMFDDYFK